MAWKDLPSRIDSIKNCIFPGFITSFVHSLATFCEDKIDFSNIFISFDGWWWWILHNLCCKIKLKEWQNNFYIALHCHCSIDYITTYIHTVYTHIMITQSIRFRHYFKHILCSSLYIYSLNTLLQCKCIDNYVFIVFSIVITRNVDVYQW